MLVLSRTTSLLLIGLALACPSRSLAVDVFEIPSPRLDDGWVTDLTGQVSQETIFELNDLCDKVHQHQNAELAVVVIDSTDGRNPRQFATQLFNHWEIGDRELDNGVLLLAALGDRKAELILGDGIDSAGEIAVAKEIMDEQIVPRFKRGDVDGALLAGAKAAAIRILGAPLGDDAMPQPLVGGGGGGNVGNGGGKAPWMPWAALFGTGGTTAAGVWGFRRYLRYRKRNCKSCGQPMELLSEVEDDEFLEKGEITEERIGSVDYDVWHCTACDEVTSIRYGAFFTRYSSCPSCRYRTKWSYETTISAATEYSTGLARVEENCKQCSYTRTYTKTIPMITKTSSSSSGSSSSGFSGGSSSGGGASGSW